MSRLETIEERAFQALLARARGDTTSALDHLNALNRLDQPSDALFSALRGWAQVYKGAFTSTPTPGCTRVQPNIGDGSDAKFVNRSENVAAFLAACLNEDTVGALYLWRQLPVSSAADLLWDVLGLAASTLGHGLHRTPDDHA